MNRKFLRRLTAVPDPRVLFILKQRPGTFVAGLSNGLSNSVRFVADMLVGEGISAGSVEVPDYNHIHRHCLKNKPTHVVIEAIWATPQKFMELAQLNPGIKWIIRGHSEIPFLAGEGIAIDWICRYVNLQNVVYAANSPASCRDVRNLVRAAHPDWTREEAEAKVLYLPNFYPAKFQFTRRKPADEFLDVACFGAIRPLKNQLIQALTAVELADFLGKTLRFHINGTRTEQGGDNNLKNIRAVFAHTRHQLVEHGWLSHSEFLQTLSEMDLGMQVSFSETFNIVAADMVVSGLPIVTSPEIAWVSKWCQAEPTNSEDVFCKMLRATDWRLRDALRVLNLRGLKSYCEQSKAEWLRYLRD
jgi:hypothetical protein